MERHICPPWVGRLMLSPLRKWRQDPEKIIGPHIVPGMTVLEPGCAMGFFSLPAARMVGPQGKVVCIDLQAVMLQQLEKRARQAGLADRIETRVCGAQSLGINDLAGKIDFAFAIAVVHEVPDQNAFFSEVAQSLKTGCRLLFAEPAGHVRIDEFKRSLSLAEQHGMRLVEQGKQFGAWWALSEKSREPKLTLR